MWRPRRVVYYVYVRNRVAHGTVYQSLAIRHSYNKRCILACVVFVRELRLTPLVSAQLLFLKNSFVKNSKHASVRERYNRYNRCLPGRKVGEPAGHKGEMSLILLTCRIFIPLFIHYHSHEFRLDLWLSQRYYAASFENIYIHTILVLSTCFHNFFSLYGMDLSRILKFTPLMYNWMPLSCKIVTQFAAAARKILYAFKDRLYRGESTLIPELTPTVNSEFT